MRLQSRQRLLVLVMPLLLASCVTVQFTKPTEAFQKSTQKSVGALSEYYKNLNTLELDVYLDEAFYTQGKEIGTVDAGGHPTALMGRFDPASIRVRLETLDLISAYASRLVELAGSEAPAKFKDSTEALGKSLVQLNQTWGEVAKTEANASKYVGPISTLIGVTGEMYISAKRDEALKKAILEGAPKVREILDLLEGELKEIESKVVQSGAKQRLVMAVGDYNSNRTGPLAERRTRLDNIRVLALRQQLLIESNPAALVSSMRKAHDAMVAFAESERKPQDLAEMVAALEAFSTRAEAVSQAINQIKTTWR